MSCEICGRGACVRSFHSIEAQERFEAKQAMSDDVDDLREEIIDMKSRIADDDSQLATLRAEVERLTHRLKVSEAFEERIKVALNQPGVSGSYVKWAAECRAAYDDRQRLQAEVERLREVYDPTIEVSGKLAEQVTALQAEVERLTFALRDAKHAVVKWASYVDEYYRGKWDLAADLKAIDTALQGGAHE